MLILISPAKTLDYQSPLATTRYTRPELLDYSQQLIREARKLSAPQIGKLMGISDKLADLNATRFHDWQPDFSPENAARRFWRLKATSIPDYRRKRSAKPILISRSSICVCFPGCTASCVRWI
jgi:Uncharacterized protein conserved in bacteria